MGWGNLQFMRSISRLKPPTNAHRSCHSFPPSRILSGNRPPRITKQPAPGELLFKVAQQNKESDNPFIIECEADGQPEPE